jgi:hypothetical protein
MGPFIVKILRWLRRILGSKISNLILNSYSEFHVIFERIKRLNGFAELAVFSVNLVCLGGG